MNLKARVDQVEAETIEHLKAERKVAIRAFIEWVTTLTTEEQYAFWRGARQNANLSGDPSPDELQMLGGCATFTPEDASLLIEIENRLPPELAERLKASGEALEAAGIHPD